LKNSKELIQQRQDRILQLLRQKQLASVAELATHFHVTPATIRRDLEVLEEQGSLKRFFGGVEYILPQSEYVRYQLGKDDQTPAKQAIAKRAAGMIANGTRFFLTVALRLSLFWTIWTISAPASSPTMPGPSTAISPRVWI